MKELFIENTIWIGLMLTFIMSVLLFWVSYNMNNGKLWRWFAIIFFILFFVLPLINEIWELF